MELQRDINSIAERCDANALGINVGKCCMVKFDNGTRSLNYRYFVNGTRAIERKSLKDLDVVLHSQLKFRDHIEYVNAKAVRTIGFLIKFTSDFKKFDVILYLYRTLVMPILT